MGQKHKRLRETRMSFPLGDIHRNRRSIYARVPQEMAQIVLKIEKLSHIIGPTPILEMVRASGLRPRLWLLIQGLFKTVRKLVLTVKFNFKTLKHLQFAMYFNLAIRSYGEGRWRLHLAEQKL